MPALKLLVVSGPSLDRLGTREPHIYGTATLADVHRACVVAAREVGATVECRQSNHEGDLVTWLSRAADEGFVGVVLNAGAYTHTSVAILDAIRAGGVPTVEVHLSHPDAREGFRRRSRIAPACVARVSGFGVLSYVLGIKGIVSLLGTPRPTRGGPGTRSTSSERLRGTKRRG